MDIPSAVDRSQGDVHPLGNPHIQLDPRYVAVVAKALTTRLAELDPANAAYYQARGADFLARWKQAMARWAAEAAPLKGVKVVVIHSDQRYLCRWLGLDQVAAIEPKPGVPPSAGYLAGLVSKLTADKPRMILRNAYNDPKAVEWLSQKIDVQVVLLPFSVGGTPRGEGPVRPVRRHHQPAAGGEQMSDMSTYFSLLWPALIAGLLVSLSHVPLGQQVLRRGIVFIDLAIAQVAALGVIVSHSAGLELHGWMTQAAAVTAALLGALLMTWTERRRPEVQEALIGILFVLASTAQILLLANNPHGGEELKDLLAGQILWVSTEQLVRATVLTALFLRRLEPLAPAHRPRRLLRRLRGDGDDVGAAGGRVPGVHDADRAGRRNLPPRRQPAAHAGLRARVRKLPGGTRRVGADRPALERGDRVGDGGARDPACT